MSDKPAQRIAASICCIGLAYFCFEYDSNLAGLGSFLALLACFD